MALPRKKVQKMMLGVANLVQSPDRYRNRTMKEVYTIGKGVNSAAFARWSREDLRELATMICEAYGERCPGVAATETTSDIEEEAQELLRNYSKEDALAFAREIFADLELQ